jgi:hypothetical protein
MNASNATMLPQQVAITHRSATSHSPNSPFTPSPFKQSTSECHLVWWFDTWTSRKAEGSHENDKRQSQCISRDIHPLDRHTPDHDAILSNLADLHNSSKVRSFSSMNDTDYVKLNFGEHGIILRYENFLTKPCQQKPFWTFRQLQTHFFKNNGNGRICRVYVFSIYLTIFPKNVKQPGEKIS